ncbi:peptide deformylase, mitochondrial [Drosophila biarmipes]|uniref:peptide deformylase, mitochondrial n=1 Tax=Drosophila biarmipes TaxID=125945 RepID=UPI0007E82931|nr:peptide deformylase, mitochondrial [Drosophila biarmipes]
MSVPPYRHFTQIGDPVLRQKAEEVSPEEIDSLEIDQIIDRMVKVLRHYDCVGVAAPQIGIPKRIIVMEFRDGKQEQFKPEIYEERKMSTLPLAVFVNPELEIISSQVNKHPEGCMSVRGYSGQVERYDKVRVRGIGKLGTPSEMELEGWSARIAQHEVDHLNGIIYVDRMDISTFNCNTWDQINAAEGRSAIWFHK